MRVAICGGGLQGVELLWLAQQAGWETVLVDKRPHPPALHLADSFLQRDLLTLPLDADGGVGAGVGGGVGGDVDGKTGAALAFDPRTLDLLAAVDLVFPALEHAEALAVLHQWCTARNLPCAFDPAAYAVSSSKLRSRELFLAVGTPIPQPCARPTFPLIAKPSGGSGSRGVRLLHSEDALRACFPAGLDTPDMLFESYCPGPSYSVEVCGTPGAYTAFQVTELYMDAVFDCRRVVAPCSAHDVVPEAAIATEALRLAEALHLHGLMDLEVIVTPEGMRVLEIDARFPSQTPTAVYLSTGINLAERLAACFVPKKQPAAGSAQAVHGVAPFRHALYEHVRCEHKELRTQGEHIMATSGPLRRIPGFFGADEALIGGLETDGCTSEGQTDACPALPEHWVATLLFTGTSAREIQERRKACLDALVRCGHVCSSTCLV